MLRWLKQLWLKIMLRYFAKRVMGIDYGCGDMIAWCDVRYFGGKMYIINQGFGVPSVEVLRGRQIYI
jgi:hypothetical protein